MKRLFFSVVFVTALCVSSSANAKWTGSQLLIIGAADNVKLDPTDDTWAMRSSVHLFWQPQTDTMLWFGYIGPRFNIASWIWMSPQIGVAGNWTPDGGDAFLASLWTGFTPHPNIFILCEADFNIYDEGFDYYGFYFAEWNFGKVALGPTFEQVNKDLILGPHLTLYTDVGPFISAQYWVAAKSDFDHMARFVVGLFF